jgi:asparagine synthase (glutamine-hydrolysing)
MSGIAGIYHLQTAKPVDPARLRSMLGAMAHRGRGKSAEWTAAGVGLGIVGADVDGGKAAQPLFSDDEAASIVFDGVLFNASTLRAELGEAGHRLPQGSDAELVLAAWRQWGVDALSRLEGLFAFAVHDFSRGSLFLARDRMGAKPLHIALLSDGALVFASELRGLLKHPLLSRQPNLTAAEDYLALGYVPDDNCLVEGVEKLAAGHYLLLQRGRAVDGPLCWWQPDFSKRVKASEGEAADYLAYLLRVVVKDYSQAASSSALMLSGGLDSGALMALMAENSRSAVHSLTLRSPQRDQDEDAEARHLAERFAGLHHSFAAPAAQVELVDSLADAFDEPIADLDMPLLMALSGEAGGHFGAALVGHGADEMFAGSRRMIFHDREERLRGRIPDFVRRGVIGPLAHALPHGDWTPRLSRWRRTLGSIAQSGTRAYARAVTRNPASKRVRIFNDAAVRALGSHIGEGRYWRVMAGAPVREPLDRAQYADWTIALPSNHLMKLDRIGHTQNIALYAPFMDRRIAEFMMALPAHMRVKKGVGKSILRRSMSRHLPKNLREQPRLGWEAPVAHWFRGGLSDEARRLTVSPTLSHTGWFDMAEIDRLVTSHQAGREDHGRVIWQMVMLEKSLSRLFHI